MYPISNAVKALFEAEQRQVLRITGTDKNGTAINITDADVVIDSFSIDRFSCIGNKLEIGTATSAQMTVKLDNYDGRFNGIVFEGTELFVEIGIADWTQSNPTVNWIPCGYFTPDEQPRSLNIITIHALDRMMQFDATMPTLTPWVTQSGDVMTDSQGNIIYFVSNVQFPVTVQNLVKRVALLCGVPFTQSLSNLPNYNYTLSALPTLQQEITFRNIIQWCAGIMGANAWIDWTGSLRFSWYGATTGYTSTTANRFSSDLHEDDITITGVQYTNTQNVTIVSGSADYAIDMTGNYLAATGIAEILPNVKNVINGFTYRPFTATVINAPYLWPMDMITFVKDGVNHTCAVTNVNFGLNGTTALAGKGETAQTNSGIAPSGMTNEQAFLVEKATRYASEQAAENMTQEQIFNKLTNNGEIQGLLLHDGKVYLNAEYIFAGTIMSNFFKGVTLQLGGYNNENGSFELLNGSGDVIGSWGNNGITINSGSINLNNGAFIVTNSGALTALNATLNGALKSTGTDINGNTINTSIAMGKIRMFGSVDDGDVQSYQPHTYLYIRTLAGNSPSVDLSGSVSKFNISSDGLLQQHSSVMEISASDGDYWNYPDERGKITIMAAEVDITTRRRYYDGTTPLITAKGSAMYSYGSESVNFNTNVNVNGNLSVTGIKPRLVATDQYSKRFLYCYETPTPMFGDVGEGIINDDGLCYVSIEPIFAQTITSNNYQVFLQNYGSGEAWVRDRNGAYFIVEGTPGLKFGWEIKARQRDYDQLRMGRADDQFAVYGKDYGAGAALHLEELRKERISA